MEGGEGEGGGGGRGKRGGRFGNLLALLPSTHSYLYLYLFCSFTDNRLQQP